MKEIIEKQILEWQQEIINQRQYILRLEGGVQAYQLLLKEIRWSRGVYIVLERVERSLVELNLLTRFTYHLMLYYS